MDSKKEKFDILKFIELNRGKYPSHSFLILVTPVIFCLSSNLTALTKEQCLSLYSEIILYDALNLKPSLTGLYYFELTHL